MIAQLLIIIGLASIGTGAYVLLRSKKKECSGDEYLWMGDGDNPFQE